MNAREYGEACAELAAAGCEIDVSEASPSEARELVAGHARREAQEVAADARFVARYRASMDWAADGYKSVIVALRHESNCSRGTAQRRVDRSKKLVHLDEVLGALSAGEITVDALDLILGLDTPGRHDALVEDQKLLVEHARDLRYADFVKVVQTWRDLHDPDDADREAGKRDEERSLFSSKTIGGQRRLDGWLTPEAGAEFDDEIDRLSEKMFEADWAEARERLGDKAGVGDLRRTAAQRRHDALQQMSRRSAAYTGECPAPRGRVVLNLHMDYGTCIAELSRHFGHPFEYPADRLCELDDGTPLVPSEALGLALGGEIRRIVFGADGHVLDYGRSRRFFTPAIADAIRARDGRCQMPGCLLPAAKCEIDHVAEHQHGGETSECNGQAHCKFHNLWKTNNLARWRQLKARDEDRFKKRRPPQL